MNRTFRLVMLLALLSLAQSLRAADALDPAPPKVNVLTPMTAPTAKPHPDVKRGAVLKPLPAGAVTNDWPWFLGPTHNAVSTETRLLKQWPATGPAVVWELTRGSGYASPSIVGQRLVYTHRQGNEVVIECLHPETGDKYWEHKYATDYEDRYQYSNGPRASPVIEGDRVWLLGVEGQFLCLELSTGRVVWQRSINTEFGVKQDFFGTVNTPLLEGDVLIVNVGAPDGPCVAGFDKRTGKVVWRVDADGWGPSYASPSPATINGQRRVFVFAGGDSDPPTGGLLSIHPGTGKLDFKYPWRSRKYESVNAMCPIVFGNSVLISATYRAGSQLLHLGPDFQPKPLWTMTDREHNTAEGELGIHWSTPVIRDGHLYAFDGRNEPDASLVCVDLKAGQVVWRETLEWKDTVTLNGRQEKIDMSPMRGSLLLVDGHFLCIGEFGHLLWLDLSPRGVKQLARTWMFAAKETWAPPVVSRGLLYVTQNGRDVLGDKPPRLLCFDLRAAAAAATGPASKAAKP